MNRLRFLFLATLLLTIGASMGVLAEPKPEMVAQSRKIYYHPNEPVEATVEFVKPNSKEVRTFQVEAWLEAGLNQRTPVQKQTMTVPAKESGSVTFKWPAEPLGQYGYALQVRATGGAQPLSATDYFTIADHYWNVALTSNNLIANTTDLPPKKAKQRLDGIRAKYANGFEQFFWAPDDFADMTPDVPVYFSGQERYHENTANIKSMIQIAHSMGIQAVTYGKSIGSGNYAAEFARAHPDWVYRSGGKLRMQAKVRALTYWNKDTNWDGKPGTSWHANSWVFYNMNKPEVVKYGSEEIARSAQMFGWDGVRFDGHFAAKGTWGDENGLHRISPEERDAQTAANIQLMKATILPKLPGFYFGYNYLNAGAEDALRTGPKEFKELCKGGGLIMNEYINQAQGVNHPLHHWADFNTRVADDAQVIKQYGGYYFPILLYRTPDQYYASAVVYASGAHPYYRWEFGAFATRYAEYIWDNKLQRIDDPTKLISAPANMWWKKFVHQRDLDATHKQVIVHLMNPPVKDVVTNDKKQALPEPMKNVVVKVSPQALGAGWKLSKATLLDPDDVSQTDAPIKGNAITVPEVKIWKVVVLDFEKG